VRGTRAQAFGSWLSRCPAGRHLTHVLDMHIQRLSSAAPVLHLRPPQSLRPRLLQLNSTRHPAHSPFRTISTALPTTVAANFFTPLQPLAINFLQRTFLPAMSTSTLDESVLAFLKTHAPNNAGAETDAVKASQTLFPEVAYTDAEKAELSQWVITASHIASSSEDAAKSAERLSSLNTHLSSRTTLLGVKPSVADIAIYQKLAPVVSKWSAEERTGEQGYHHIVRHVDFVQNSPVFGLKLDDKVNIDPNSVVFNIKPVDAKAEKERKKKEKEAAAAASGATPTTLTGSQGGQGGQGGKSKKEKAKGLVQAAGDAVAGAVAGKPTSADAPADAPAGAPEGAPTQKKEKKPKQPKPQKAYVLLHHAFADYQLTWGKCTCRETSHTSPHRPTCRPHPQVRNPPQRRLPLRIHHRMRRRTRHRKHLRI
jgi:aminoacyl tRNA synthase complex-interacting multifunctional protein 1